MLNFKIKPKTFGPISVKTDICFTFDYQQYRPVKCKM